MSLDERLRHELARAANGVHPDVEHHLGRVMQRGRRHTRIRLIGRVVTAAALITAFVLIDLTVVRDPAPVADSLSGTFATTVEPGQPVLDDPGMTGVWSLHFSPDGLLSVTAPDTYQGVLSGALYQSTKESFRTNLFEQDLCSGHGLGSYRWQIVNDTLTFTVVEDGCEPRVMLMTSQVWRDER
jgi:hypothetical protein